MTVEPGPVSALAALDGPLQPLPPSGPGFECVRTVRTGDADRDERLRLDAVARFLQDAATDHLAELRRFDTEGVWVVRRTVIDVRNPVRRGSRVRLRRWCSAMSTRWATMRVDLDDADGGRIETEAFWIKIDPAMGRPARISDALEAELSARTVEHRLRWRPLLPDAAPADADKAPFVLRSVDIDLMQHVNNAVYLQIVEDRLRAVPALSAASHRVVIEYLRPIAPDASVTVHTRADR